MLLFDRVCSAGYDSLTRTTKSACSVEVTSSTKQCGLASDVLSSPLEQLTFLRSAFSTGCIEFGGVETAPSEAIKLYLNFICSVFLSSFRDFQLMMDRLQAFSEGPRFI